MHVVSLAPTGFVVVNADDQVEPIVLLSPRVSTSTVTPTLCGQSVDDRSPCKVERTKKMDWTEARLNDNLAMWGRAEGSAHGYPGRGSAWRRAYDRGDDRYPRASVRKEHMGPE